MAKVIVIGGGVAGLSAAHELVDRGYAVEVLERNPRYLGGKARSVDAPGTNGIELATLPCPRSNGSLDSAIPRCIHNSASSG